MDSTIRDRLRSSGLPDKYHDLILGDRGPLGRVALAWVQQDMESSIDCGIPVKVVHKDVDLAESVMFGIARSAVCRGLPVSVFSMVDLVHKVIDRDFVDLLGKGLFCTLTV